MKRTLAFIAVALAAGCAGPSGRDSGPTDAERRLEAERDLERDCRMAARMHTYDRRCPQPDPMEGPPPPESPGLPSVKLPR